MEAGARGAVDGPPLSTLSITLPSAAATARPRARPHASPAGVQPGTPEVNLLKTRRCFPLNKCNFVVRNKCL